MVRLATDDGWSSPPVSVARTFGARLRGLRPRAGDRALLLLGGAVHSFGMREPLWIVAIDRQGNVLRVGWLAPNRFGRMRHARFVLELAATVPPPPRRQLRVDG